MVLASNIPNAHATSHGYFEVRPSDIAGRTDILLIDVREESDLLGPDGHIHGVKHIPLKDVRAFVERRNEKSSPVVLVCQNGRASATLATSLARDFPQQQVVVLVGGMTRWLAEERPVARTKTYL